MPNEYIITLKNMGEENIKFRLKNIDKIRNYFIEEINQNEMISKKHRRVCKAVNYIEHLLILASVVTGCVSISAFASLVGISEGITNSAVELNICAITTGIKKYKSIIKKKHNKIVLSAKTKLNTIQVLMSRAVIDS